MELFQVLDCNTTLGTCCSSYGLASIFNTLLKILGIIQIIAPILLIIMTTVQLIKLVINPEEKGGNKKIFNKFLATLFIFFLPIIVDAVMSVIPDSVGVAACFRESLNLDEIGRTVQNDYLDEDGQFKNYYSFISGQYEPGVPLPAPTPGDSRPNMWGNGGGTSDVPISSSTSSGTGAQMVAYAKQFVGKPYSWGSYWNGEIPYTPTDCSGFVGGVYKHFGITLPRTTEQMWYNHNQFQEIRRDPTTGAYPVQAGDIVLYKGHVAMLTGNGYEMIHNVRKGITISPNFTTWSKTSFPIRGVYRIIGTR